MYSRPLLPFRARPIPETTVRRSPGRRTQPGDPETDADQPATVKAYRRPVKAQAVLTRRSLDSGGPGAQD